MEESKNSKNHMKMFEFEIGGFCTDVSKMPCFYFALIFNSTLGRGRMRRTVGTQEAYEITIVFTRNTGETEVGGDK